MLRKLRSVAAEGAGSLPSFSPWGSSISKGGGSGSSPITVPTTNNRRAALLGWMFLIISGLLVLNFGFIFFGGTSGAYWMEEKFRMKSRAVRHLSLECAGEGVACNPRNLLILQTSDGSSSYSRMLDAMQPIQLAYASQWGFTYLRWDGLARGRQTWMATYNRIYLLYELYRQGRYHWVLFMDPDAVFTDPSLSIEDLLDDSYAVIGCRGGDDPAMPWDINIGVAFFNLKHADFGDLMNRWLWEIKMVSDHKLHRGNTESYVAMTTGPPVRDDQQMFHHIMKRHPKVTSIIKRYIDEESLLFNYKEGKYIAHLIRADNKDQEARLAELLQVKAKFFKRLAEVEGERADAALWAVAAKAKAKQEEKGEEEEGKEGGEGEGSRVHEEEEKKTDENIEHKKQS